MTLNEGFNKSFVPNSDLEFRREEVDRKILSAERWNFNYKKFEVYRAFVSFSENENIFKSRPVVVITDKGDTVDCYKVTSKRKDGESYYQKYPIEGWELAGLSKPCYIILTSKVEISKDFFYDRLGKLKSTDIDNLKEIGL